MRTKKKRKVRLNLKRFLPFILILAVLIVGLVLGIKKLASKPENPTGDPGKKQEEPQPKQPEYSTITIRCIGDVMAHLDQIKSAKMEDGTYDFSDSFMYVKEYLDEADLSLANIETTFSGDGSYSGYPAFDAPDALAKNVKDAGIDVALFANNHMLDTKLDGAKRTVQVLRDAGLTVVGARTSTDEPRSQIVNVKGVKLGIVAYTYETDMVKGKRTLNGSSSSGMDGAADFINTFRYYKIEQDQKAIADEIAWCKANGADVVICYLHWGNEYKQTPSKNDKALAKYLAENGADIIFASHPHVLQPFENIELGTFEEVKTSDGAVEVVAHSKKVPVFYSMGNFISNQRTETLSSNQGKETAAKTEQGIIAEVKLTVCLDDGSFVIDGTDYIPTWVDRYKEGDTFEYRVIPLTNGFEKNETLKLSGHLDRAKEALKAINETVGN